VFTRFPARLNEGFNKTLDRVVRPVVYRRGRSWSAFHVCGYTGLVLATWLAMGLALHQHLSFWTMFGIVLAAVLVFFGLAWLTRVLQGGESLTYYHHELTILAVAAALAWVSGQPILPYLDITILAIGLFLACGRVGCLMVGCCHGRPFGWGVCYREEHAAAGFVRYLVGVRLFPVQALEALWVAGVVLIGSLLVLDGRPPGTALAWAVVSYGMGRFLFEFLRGDAARPYYAGFSEPQWTSLVLILLVAAAELGGILPRHSWHLGAAGLLAVAMIAVALNRRLRTGPRHRLSHPRHIQELAEVLERVSALAPAAAALASQNPAPGAVRVLSTSEGVQVSATRIERASGAMIHYAFSFEDGTMNDRAARTLTRLILQLRRVGGSGEMIKGHQGVYHLVLHA
jgi:prolipoprotein diacylglyceryltransferase